MNNYPEIQEELQGKTPKEKEAIISNYTEHLKMQTIWKLFYELDKSSQEEMLETFQEIIEEE